MRIWSMTAMISFLEYIASGRLCHDRGKAGTVHRGIYADFTIIFRVRICTFLIRPEEKPPQEDNVFLPQGS